MRAATLLLCVPLAACAAGGASSERPVADAVNAQAAAGAPAAQSPPAAASGSAAAAPAPAAQPAVAAAPPMSSSQRLTQARVDCWMKVEQQKRMRDIDRRIAFVDKCVADALKEPSQ